MRSGRELICSSHSGPGCPGVRVRHGIGRCHRGECRRGFYRFSFGSTLTGLTWVVDVYVLTFASLLLLAGSLATAFGSRRLYLVGMILFLVASIGCAIAPSEATLIAARAVEGIGAALFMPSSLALLVGTFTEPGQRAKMLGLWSAMVATSAAIGPTVGGVLVGAFGWRSIFLINVPVVVAGLVLTALVIPSTPGTGQRVSPVGNLLFFVVVASGAYVLIQGRSSGFGARSVIFAAALLVIGGLVLIVEQSRTATPVMPWILFARPAFGVPNVVGFLYSGALSATCTSWGCSCRTPATSAHSSPVYSSCL